MRKPHQLFQFTSSTGCYIYQHLCDKLSRVISSWTHCFDSSLMTGCLFSHAVHQTDMRWLHNTAQVLSLLQWKTPRKKGRRDTERKNCTHAKFAEKQVKTVSEKHP